MIQITAKTEDYIKPCPFCGTQGELYKNVRQFNGSPDEEDYYIGCSNCDIWLGNDFNYDEWGDVICDYATPEAAIKDWNKRYK